MYNICNRRLIISTYMLIKKNIGVLYILLKMRVAVSILHKFNGPRRKIAKNAGRYLGLVRSVWRVALIPLIISKSICRKLCPRSSFCPEILYQTFSKAQSCSPPPWNWRILGRTSPQLLSRSATKFREAPQSRPISDDFLKSNRNRELIGT